MLARGQNIGHIYVLVYEMDTSIATTTLSLKVKTYIYIYESNCSRFQQIFYRHGAIQHER